MNNLIIATSIFIVSCNNGKIEQELKQLIGTEIIIPYNSLYSNHAMKEQCKSGDYSYVVYFDSLVCSSCTLKNMYYWEVMNDSILQLGKKVDFVFIFSPKKNETNRFLNDLKHSRIEMPALVDTAGYFLRANKQIPQNPNAHAFFLNKQGKVLVVGNAQNNPEIEKLIFKVLQ